MFSIDVEYILSKLHFLLTFKRYRIIVSIKIYDRWENFFFLITLSAMTNDKKEVEISEI